MLTLRELVAASCGMSWQFQLPSLSPQPIAAALSIPMFKQQQVQASSQARCFGKQKA